MRVLDLDMDYFMTEIANTPFSCKERLDEEYYGDSVWSSDKVRQFLENNLGLSKIHKIPGRIVNGHNEALFFWEELINSKKLSDPFDVVHVDSHADLGLGDASWSFLQSSFLTLSIESRRRIREYEFCDKIKEIKVTVIVFDENQILRMDQYWESQMIDKYRSRAIQQNNHITLTEQLRMQADKETLEWIDDFTKNQMIRKIPHGNYDIKIFDSPFDLEVEINKKASAEETKLSRLIANYDWDYKEGKRPEDRLKKYWEVIAGEWHKPWNYELKKDLKPQEKRKIKDKAWAEQEHTIGEVGSTYTIQGFDLNYAGIILGKSVTYRNGKIEFIPSESSNDKVHKRRTMSDGSMQNFGEELLKHEIRVLMTRGVNGMYIYACDPKLRAALLEAAK